MSPSKMYPCLRYQDAPAAIDFLCKAFGFERHRIFADDTALTEADLSFVDFDTFSSDDYTPGTYN